ncbi:RidA family protein [uncultured Jatrophihabitans sp.]|uniref:RidA family protein n=1 Tax=uncultured Jatrophihabitans sp. TaxID=1610747 RepID=UPI0035CC8B26
MPVELSSPQGLLHPVPYHHVAVSVGSRQVHMAGQTARPADGGTVEHLDLAAQISEALRRIGTGLAGVGGSFADVARLTFYIPNWDSGKIDAFTSGIADVVDELGIPQPWPPTTVLGIAQLWESDLLVEIEVVANLA